MVPHRHHHLFTMCFQFSSQVRGTNVVVAGFVDAAPASFKYLLNRGMSIVVVVGGAAEALECRPGLSKLVLNKRKGFVKQACYAGASLVPCFSFGENDLFDQVSAQPGSLLHGFQHTIQSTLGFSRTSHSFLLLFLLLLYFF
jgi:hypothetical protein